MSSIEQKGSDAKAIAQLKRQIKELERKIREIPKLKMVKGNSGEYQLVVEDNGVKRRIDATTEDGKRRKVVQEDLDLKGKNIKNVGTISAKTVDN